MEHLRPVRLLLLAALVLGALVALPGPTPATGQDPAAELEEVRARALEATQALADAESRLGTLEQDIADAQAQTEQAQAQIASLQAGVEELLVQQYVRPHDELLIGTDLTRMTRADAMARIVTHGDVDALDRYRAATSDLDEASARLADLQAQQEEAVADLQARQGELEAEIARLEELERQRRAEEERRRRAAAAAAAAAAADDDEEEPPPDDGGGGSTTPPPSGGGITCPVPGSTFVDTWGAPRGSGRSHEGVDMMAGFGTHIFAPASGNVEFRTVSTGGLSFFLYGDNGDTYFGTHLQGYQGGNRRVSAGEHIGYVGDSGNAAGTPHLHFEIHPGGGGPVNPYPATAAACF